LVLGAEPEIADDAFRSLQEGKIIPSSYPDTVADGLRTSLGKRTFPIIQRYVDGIVTAGEAEIIAAMRTIWERMKLVVEPSAAVPLATVLSGCVDLAGQRVGIILSGGNVALDTLPWQVK
jgi:threonine dehydratase